MKIGNKVRIDYDLAVKADDYIAMREVQLYPKSRYRYKGMGRDDGGPEYAMLLLTSTRVAGRSRLVWVKPEYVVAL